MVLMKEEDALDREWINWFREQITAYGESEEESYNAKITGFEWARVICQRLNSTKDMEHARTDVIKYRREVFTLSSELRKRKL